MKSTDISIIIIIEMYRKRQNYIPRTVVIVFLISTSSALKVDLCFVKNIETLIICHLIFKKKRNMDDSDLTIVYRNCGLEF